MAPLLVAWVILLAPNLESAQAINGGGQTLYVNKYSPNASTTPGCEPEAEPFTEIGSTSPSSGAVGAAASGDTIFICGSPDADSDPYRPNAGVAGIPVGAKDLTFAGDGPGLTVIDGEGERTQFFTTDSGDYLNLQSMTVRNGLDINTGGAVEAGGRVVNVEDVHFLGNEAIGFGSGGGAIYAGSVNVSNSVFRDNRAARSGPTFGFHKGGAIYAEGSVSTDGNSEFRNNSADGSGGAIFADGSGSDPGLISITDTVFLENSTDSGSGGSTFSNGPTSVDGSVFQDSVAGSQSGGDSGPGDGGAIWAAGTVDIAESLFEGNSAPGISRSGVGGAVASVEGIAIERSDFVENSAKQWGGALSAGAGVEIDDTGFRENEVLGDGSFGGAIYAQFGSGTSTVEGSSFFGNSATSGGSYAGAIRVFGALLSVTNSTFNGNEAADAPAISSSDDVLLNSVTASANSGPRDITSGGDLTIGGSIIDETGETCVAPGTKGNLGGNVIADTTASTGDCLPFVGTGGGPANRVDPATIELQPLTDNGGPTETMALGFDSVARSSSAGNCPPSDQRGLVRPSTDCSSGAYQLTTEELTVNKAGAGTGTVTSSPAGIDCGPGCTTETAEFAQNPPFTTVTLTAVAVPGSSFLGWSRPECADTAPCEVPLDEAQEVAANFVLNHELNVVKGGSGTGTVTSVPAGIDCGPSCRFDFVQDTVVTLTAMPDLDSTFEGFSGACTSTSQCTVTLDQAREVTATFTRIPSPGEPKLRASFAGPGKVRAGRAFTTRMKVANRAKPPNQSLRINGDSQTSATDLKSCLILPGTMVPVRAKGAKVRGRKLCWSKNTLSAGEKVTYTARIKVTRSPGVPAGPRARSATLKASVTASNTSGETFQASGKKTVRITPAKPRRPEPPTG